MFLLNSYLASSKWRFLLVAVLIACCSITRAQEAPVSDTARSEGVEVYDEEENENNTNEQEEEVAPSLRTVPDSAVTRYKADPDFAYANDPEYWEKPDKKKERTAKPRREREQREISMFDFSGIFGVVKLLFIVVMIALLAFLIYKLMGNRWPWQQPAKLKEEEAIAEEDLNVDELQQKIRQAIADKKFRLAIRYSYLFTLRRMDEKGWIRLDARSTNLDYVKQMKPHDPNGHFTYLTNVYDYVWYGEFELNEEQFNLVYKDFQNFLNTYSH
jgi:hypothetical protein